MTGLVRPTSGVSTRAEALTRTVVERGPAMIEVAAMSKVYPSGGEDVVANRDVSLTIAAGELVVLAGPSGSGKTTLLNLIGALDVPTAGRVHVDGVGLDTLSPKEVARFRRDRVGFVFQHSNLVSSLSVLENTLLQRRLQGRLTRADVAAARALLDRVGLAARADALPGQLSVGQQQRVAVVRAVAAAPAVVVADEPTASLDGPNAEVVLRLLRELNAERGVTVVVSSHDQRVIDAGGRVVRLEDGRVVDDGVAP